MIHNYYILFNLKDNINYTYLLQLYQVAEYNKQSKRYDTIKYTSQKQLAVSSGITASSLRVILESDRYSNYLTVDKSSKTITLLNNFTDTTKPFIHLTASMVNYLLTVEADNKNLFIKYFLYIKYYCGMYRGKEQNFTADQFLSFIGLSCKSHKYKNYLSQYNSLLQMSGYLRVRTQRDNRGFIRNYYSFNLN